MIDHSVQNDIDEQDAGPADAAGAAADPVAERDQRIAELEDRLKRAVAETENVRRRLEREKVDAQAYAMTAFARDLLGVADNLKRAVEAIPADAREGDAMQQIVTGIEMTERELHTVLARHGIERVVAVGQRLDPNRHQAMIEVHSDEHEPGHVVAELQPGYVIKDRLLRPALVSVAKTRD